MVTTKQKSVVDTQKVKRKELKQTTIESHQIMKEEDRKERNELQNRQKMINKMAVVKSYLSKITLNYFLYTTNYWMKKLRRQSHLQDYQKE